jgi:acyl-[acyl-carrier-protein]-phospholipid O-acyltransferase/long-chain-fatty-acid--[acyl-carrier-protein] ligase
VASRKHAAHYSIIPEIAYDINATIMFGTNTFLAAYGKKAHVYDFYNIRLSARIP